MLGMTASANHTADVACSAEFGHHVYMRNLAVCLAAAIMLCACARPLIVPEPLPMAHNDPSKILAYSESPSQKSPRWPVLIEPDPSLKSKRSQVSLFHAGNRFTDWRARDTYLGKVQPLLGQRCVSCHSCTDSPCNMKLTSYEGIRRGASPINYYTVRLGEAPDPKTSLGAQSFYSVIDFFTVDSTQGSLLYRLVEQGMQNSLASDPAGAFDLEGVRELQNRYDQSAAYQCPSDMTAYELYRKRHPLAGMPFGLPRLNNTEFAILHNWMAAGAKGPAPENFPELYLPSQPRVIDTWERWLNQDTPKSRLLGRYLYEHLFAAHIHFEEMPGEFYQLIRARTPPGSGRVSGLDEIITPLATDDPGVDRVYYRLRKITELIARKKHVVWRVNDTTLQGLDDHFLKPPWRVPDHQIVLPDYRYTNPFRVFAQIPARMRHRFMLENSKLIVEAMVRSPVCLGRSATYAIADHFWVFFLRPESDVSSGAPFFRISERALETMEEDMMRRIAEPTVRGRFDNNRVYTNGYEQALRRDLQAQVDRGLRSHAGLGLGDLWDGGGENPNAWLTVLRHDASATVHYGQEGGLPQSIWVLSFANFERLYYNLVVDFKFWGSVAHKLGTWQSMGHARLDGEDLFVSFLPEASRATTREYYSGGMKLPAQIITGYIGKFFTGKKIERYIDLYPILSAGRPALTSLPGKERADHEFARLIQARMSPDVRVSDDRLNGRMSDAQNIYVSAPIGQITLGKMLDFEQWEHAMRQVTEDRGQGRYAPYLPSITYLRVGRNGEYRLYTLISNRGYLSHNIIFYKDQERDPKRDTISIYRGAVGDYPELFLDVPLDMASDFLGRVQALDEINYREGLRTLKQDYGIRRNSVEFWPFVDWLHQSLANEPDGYLYGGIIDLSKYDLYDRN